MRYNRCMRRAVQTLSLLILVALPLAVYAQSAPASDEMKTAVLTQLLHDPRTAQMPPAQLQQLVDALAQQAAAQNITPDDLRFQPSGFGEVPVTSAPRATVLCDGNFFGGCTVSNALGFIGDNPTLPLYFLVTSGLLVLLIVRMKRHHHALGHFDTPAAPATAVAQPTNPQQGMYV